MIFTAVIALLVFLYIFGALAQIERVVGSIFNSSLAKVQFFVTSAHIKYQEQTSKTDLGQEIERLKFEINQLIAKNAELRIFEQENRSLRENLRFLKTENYKYVMANIISRGETIDISRRTEVLFIDKGRDYGVYDGLSVVSGDGIIVGKIIETKAKTAKVYLSNNEKCKLAATILNQAGSAGITEGELGLTIKMNFIPQTTVLSKGDIVATSGLEGEIPRGLVIGKISQIMKESNDLWQTAIIEPIVDPEDLIMVSILFP